jgi:hypothetical protein
MPTPLRPVDFFIVDPIAPIIVEHIGGAVVAEDLTLSAVDSTSMVSFAGGTAVELLNGNTVIATSLDTTKFARLRRDMATAMQGDSTIQMAKGFGNVLAIGDVSTTYSHLLGDNEYRAIMLCNHGNASATAKVYIATLADAVTTADAQLGATGAGTIGATGAFTAWPARGWARIKTSGGTLREIVYYYSRTNDALDIALSAYRGRLGTTAAAGAASDIVEAVPGIRIGKEAPTVEGLIQTIATGRTAPTGITWSTAVTEAAGLDMGTLSATLNYGLWIHREIQFYTGPSSGMETRINVVCNGETTPYSGMYRVAMSWNTDASSHRIYRGADTMPDFTSPLATTGLPATIGLTPPVSGTTTYYVCVREIDPYGVIGYNTFSRQYTIDSTGALMNVVSPPADVSITDIGSGYARLRATYHTGVDTVDADTFRYYLTTDGSTPDPATDTPVDVTMAIGQGLSGDRVLDITVGPFDFAAILNLIVTSYSTTTLEESQGSTMATAVALLTVPQTPSRGGGFSSALGSYTTSGIDAGAPFELTTTYLDAPTNLVYWRSMPGCTELWANSTLVWRALASGQNEVSLHIPSDYTLVEGAVSGAGAATPIQVASATRLYVCVNSVRKVDINVTAKTITAASFEATGAMGTDGLPLPPSASTNTATIGPLFSVYDPVLGYWRPFAIGALSDALQMNYIIQRKS